MTIAWYINRLRSMEPGEAAHRIAEKAKKSLARNRLEGWQRYDRGSGPPPALAGLAERVAAAPPKLRKAIATVAGETLSGKFSALGADWPPRTQDKLFPESLWRLDPVSGGLWPGADAYCFDIAYRHERKLGDIKYVWEINRLQFLQALAAQVLLTGDRRALGAIAAALSSWFNANPPFRGVAWNSGIELALRSISLLIVASLCGQSLSPQTVRQIRTMLNANAFWLGRYRSLFSSANNHLIAESAGLLLTALAMPEMPNAAHIESRERALLTEELDKQIFADGVPAEQSPSYGAFTIELVLLAAHSARHVGRPLPLRLNQRLEAFARHIAWLSDAHGNVPAIGDGDEGRVFALGGHEEHYPASVAAAIADFLGGPAFGPRPRQAQLRDAVFEAPAVSGPLASGLKSFPQGGYTVFRGNHAGRDAFLLIDHGPLGYLGIAAHGHADALAILLSLDGEPLFVDSGTYLYHSGGAWRDWFRSSSAHNTLTLADSCQSTISGSFNWSHKANARLDELVDGPDWRLRASHDGYVKGFGVRHERTVAPTATGFAICDRLLGSGGGRAEVAFQLAIDCEAKVDGAIVTILRHNTKSAQLRFMTPGEVSAIRGGDIGGGWVSPQFGRKYPAWRISWKGTIPPDGAVVAIDIGE
ncbi:MAG: alginate lyase family protein [Hyphomicrobiales bacterium]